MTAQAPAPPAPAAPAPPLCEGLAFLVVEDHAIQRKLVARLLATLGAAAVHEACDGPAALRVAHEAALALDIVVSDLSMPGMNGLQLAEALGRNRPGVSMILFSALGPRMLQTSCALAAHAPVRLLGSVTKPLTRATLAPLIAAHRAGAAATTGISSKKCPQAALVLPGQLRFL